ncbi:WD40 repeat-like protein [Acaromyces ingoldii]|uniref:methylated diphthine methylhydrolase n=1 Tax=Acaromyces ingoldii TaxID=215250 RepID=A0A316YK54_9BASI|nr:WD40 repeat-like protein [Acaromyces ingoldii]PWN89581.1 WD40 repeat-like protein [Acaromyces ingoldii]
MTRQAASLYSASTDLSADSIESHPGTRGLFALGTYQVDQAQEEGQPADENSNTSPEYSRRGRLTLHQTGTDGEGKVSCRTLSSLDTAAILDMKWLASGSRLSAALATSDLAFFHLNKGSLSPADTLKMNDVGALCLSLDWSDRRGLGAEGGSGPTKGIVSQSDGSLAYIPDLEVALSSKGNIESWAAHDYEAWIAAWDCWSDGNICWSGGDDLTLKGWDVREASRQPTFQVRKAFEGGVTTLQSHHLRQHLWAVGSYDGHLRLFDARKPLRPLSSTNVGGGVWRAKWHPTDSESLLVGCMHDGFKILKLPNDPASGDMDVMVRFDEHQSLAYGCDWDRSLSEPCSHVYSCSFYDSRLHIWEA